jgi:hypothetical protein
VKQIITVTAAALFLVFAACTDFSASYQNIDEGEFRMLNFMFANAEYPWTWNMWMSYSLADIAPGDSVILTAVFAGKKKDLHNDIDWRVSFNAAVDNYGMETAVSSEPIDKYGRIIDTSFSKNTQAIAFKFKIPEDIVRKSASIPENWTDMLPSYVKSSLPEKFKSITKNQAVDLIEQHEEYMRNGDYTNWELDERLLPALFQFFTVPVIITANVKNEGRQHKIQCSHSVRYNSRFHVYLYNGSSIPINHNPYIDYVLMYKVKGDNIMSFDDKSGKQYSWVFLSVTDTNTIIVEDGYSYFLDWYSSPFDETITMDAALLGSTYNAGEKHWVYWQFKLDENEKRDVPFSRQMDIDNMFGRVIIPKDKSIKNFTLWITIKDEVINEKLRPRGSALGEYQVKFVYR